MPGFGVLAGVDWLAVWAFGPVRVTRVRCVRVTCLAESQFASEMLAVCWEQAGWCWSGGRFSVLSAQQSQWIFIHCSIHVRFISREG